jgi:thymidylate kinase
MLRVGVVGPCGSGKTTLIHLLQVKRRDVDFRHIAQEHSYVADMWLRLVDPDILIFLEVSYNVATSRRRLNWREAEYQEQLRRLRHARQHASLVIATDQLSQEQIAKQASDFIDHFLINKSV